MRESYMSITIKGRIEIITLICVTKFTKPLKMKPRTALMKKNYEKKSYSRNRIL